MSAATCRACGADIIWMATVNGKPMPIDATPNPDGNVEIVHDPATGRDLAHVHAPGQTAMFGAGERWMPHFATCPNWEPTP